MRELLGEAPFLTSDRRHPKSKVVWAIWDGSHRIALLTAEKTTLQRLGNVGSRNEAFDGSTKQKSARIYNALISLSNSQPLVRRLILAQVNSLSGVEHDAP